LSVDLWVDGIRVWARVEILLVLASKMRKKASLGELGSQHIGKLRISTKKSVHLVEDVYCLMLQCRRTDTGRFCLIERTSIHHGACNLEDFRVL